ARGVLHRPGARELARRRGGDARTGGRDTGAELYKGTVADSVVVTWDGRTAAGALADNGRYLLRVTPRSPTPDGPRARQVLLEVKQEPPDTLPWPPDLTTPPLLPERTSGAPAFRSLAAGRGVGAAAVALPSLLAQGKDAT